MAIYLTFRWLTKVLNILKADLRRWHSTRVGEVCSTSAVLNLWSTDHQWSTAICLVVRKD